MSTQPQAARGGGSESGFDDRVPALDGIRGLAVIQVLLIHFAILNEVPRSTVVDKFVGQVFGSGWIAMDSFFVLSGFLITGILYDAKTAGVRNYFRNFYARRSLRIFPAHYVYLIFLMFLVPFLFSTDHKAVDIVRHDWFWFAGYAGNVRIALDHDLRPDKFFTSHLWSLSVEEQFYVLWPVVVLLLSRRHLIGFCVLATVAAFAIRVAQAADGVNGWVIYTMTFTRMDSLAIGALVALVLRNPQDLRWVKRWLWPIAIFCAGLIAVPALIQGQLYLWGTWSLVVVHTPLSILYGLLIISLATGRRGSWLDRKFSNRGLTTLGRYSYSMYLFHLSVAFFLFRHFDIGPSVPTVLGSHLPGALVFAAAAFVPTFAIGWLSWHVLEGPALSLKRFFPYTRGEDAAKQRASHSQREPAAVLAPAPVVSGGD